MQLVSPAEAAYFGTEALDALRDDAAAEIVAHNRRIAAALTECRRLVALIGAPDVCMTQGYDFSDILDMLADITPTFDAAQIARVAEQVAA